MALALAYVTAMIGAFFATMVFNHYLGRKRQYQLWWSVGLALYALGAFFWFLREVFGTSSPVFRLWYLTGAMLVPAYLGTGSLWLFVSTRRRAVPSTSLGAVAMWATVALVAVSVVAAVLALATPFRSPLLHLPTSHVLTSKDPVTGESFYPVYVGALTALLNAYGTILLVGTAAWSVWTALRARLRMSRHDAAADSAARATATQFAVSNVLVTAGAILPALGGSLEALNMPQVHLWLLLIGLAVIFAGVLVNPYSYERRPVWSEWWGRVLGRGRARPSARS